MAIIIDPTLSTTNFSEIIKICKENPKEVVITCLSPMQKEYLEKKVSNVVKCVGINWPIEERLKLSEIYSYWDKLEELKEAKFKPWPDIFPYEMNVAKIYRYYLINWDILFLLVTTILNQKLLICKNENLIAIGKDPMFFAAVKSATVNQEVYLQKIYLKKNKKHILLYIKRLLVVAVYEIFLWYHQRIKNRKMVYIDRHRQTLPLFSSLMAQIDILFFTEPYSVIRKRLFSNFSQVRIEEVTNKLSEKMIYLFSKYPSNSNKFWRHSMLKNFISSLQFIVKNDIVSGFYIWKNFDEISPNAALCINWIGITHQFIRSWCRANNKPFMVLQHGIHIGGVISPEERIIDADVFFCWGEEMKKSFISAFPENRKKCIKIVGNPVYDKITNSNQSSTTDLLSKNGQSYQILIAPSGGSLLFRDYEKIFWDEIEQAVIYLPEIKWIIKLHDQYLFKDEIRNRFEKLGAIVIEKGNIFDFIRQSKLIVTEVSTAALDAMIIQKPVIIFNLLNLPERFSEFGAGIIIKERGMFYKELKNLLKKDFFDSGLIKRQEKFVNIFNKPDAINNIVTLLNKAI
jgi:hypothetical protein